MIKYALKRILWMIPILFGVIIIVFTICHYMSGDPVLLMLDSDYTQEEYQLTAEKYGLDKPFLEQLFDYIKNFVLHGSLGTSYSTGRAVTKELSGRIWVSIRLGLMSIFLTTIIAIPIGIISAIHQNSILDYGVSFTAIFLASMPGFWVALMLIILFCLHLKWFPAAGLGSWKAYVLPVLCNALSPLAITLRMTRSSMLEVIRQDYIRTARAKGLTEQVITVRHAFKNALIPVITVIGAQCSMVIGGSVVIESVFSIQGMGTRLVTAINSRDYQVILGITIVISIFSMVMQLVVDLLYAAFDPRIKAEFSKGNKAKKKKRPQRPKAEGGITMAGLHFTKKKATFVHGERLGRRSQVVEVWKRFKKRKISVIGLSIILFLVLVTALADVLAPYDFSYQELAMRLQFPSLAHPFGTDAFGRDILTRILYGGRTSLLVSLLGCMIALGGGAIVGSVAGFYSGKVDIMLMRLMDVISAVPGVLLAVVISSALGTGVWQTAMAVSISGIPSSARMLRATVLSIRGQEYVEAARAYGSKDWRIITKHIIPNCIAPLIVDTTLRLGGNIMMISGLSFIGLGVQEPYAEWGAMLNSGRAFIRDFWPLITFPGVAILLAMLGFNLAGDGLRDALDPKLKQ